MKMFIPLTKVDEEKRLVYGVATAEVPDKSGEIFDYESSKPHYQKWSGDIEKATDGKSLGNVRAMHGKVAAGKLTDIVFNDDSKQIEVCAKIVDDAEWKKVLEGVYTGFSHGGAYVRKWKDDSDGSLTRYTAAPSELSIVDNPCVPTATFTMIKADGSQVEQAFKAPEQEPDNAEVLAKAQELAKGDESKVFDLLEEARAELKKEAPATPNAPSEELEQVWKAKDGTTFKKKADAVAHNESLAKEGPADKLTAALESLKATVEKVEKREYSEEDRKAMAAKGHAMRDGSYPIANKSDLKNAIQAYGRAKNKAATKRFIIKRARALGAVDLLPDGWVKAGKADFGDELQKDLHTVARLSCLIQELNWLQESTEWEAESEGDDSPVPAKLKEQVSALCGTLRAMVAEETEELLDDSEVEEYGELLEAAAGNLIPEHLDALKKACPKAEKYSVKAPEVVAPPKDDTFEKLGAENTQLRKAVDDAVTVIEQLKARVEKLEAMPEPPKAATLQVVEKQEDGMQKLLDMAAANPEAAAQMLIKAAQRSPINLLHR